MKQTTPLFSIMAIAVVITVSLGLLLSCGQAFAAGNASEAPAGENIDTTRMAGREMPRQVNLQTLSAAILTKLGLTEEAAQSYAFWFWGAPLLAVLILLAMLFRPLKKQKPADIKQRVSVSAKPVKSKDPKPLAAPPLPEPATDKDRVLKFFFGLYKQQIGADSKAPSQIYLVDTRPTYPNETYEMRVMQGNEWFARRMSMGLLGQGGGSRSKCFYVIFDSHMVLKIPPVPIVDFSAYHKQVEADARIVSRLTPGQCIVPRIGVILKAVHKFPKSEHLSEEVLEKQYVQLVKRDSSYQKYLKIGPTFAFFMDLSKHFFLSTTLDEIHRRDYQLVSEALKNPDLLWDQHGFVCRYGEDVATVCQKLQEIYYQSETRMRQLVQEANVSKEVSSFEFKEWYLTHLAGEVIDPDAQKLPHELIERINRHMSSIIKNNHDAIEKYRRRVKKYIQETRFSQNRLQMENLASNTLAFLNWIGTRGLALRDLKPENLFVAGDPNDYPYFLSDPMRFSIGLIDVETAVVVDAESQDQIPQPQLAGTPLYATPSHLLPNLIIGEVFGDVQKILLLQDWYATIAIIFKIITGENLFISTAGLFPEIVAKLKLVDPAGPDLEKDVADISMIFWASAKAEFEEAIANHYAVFSRVEVKAPANFVHDIVKSMHRDSNKLSKGLDQMISGQQVFASRKRRQFLMDAPAEKIAKMKTKLASNTQDNDNQAGQRQKAFELLEQIEKLKTDLERKLEAAALLKAAGAPIAADQLLQALFQIVFSAMYLPKWPKLTPSKWMGRSDLPDDMDTYQATI